MGSSLSIVNDTPHAWLCKIGPDEAAIEVVGIVSNVLAIAGGIFSAAFSAAGVVGSLAKVSAKAIDAVGHVADVLDVTAALADSINYAYATNGYRLIEPNTKSTWGGLTLSLWQQGTCVYTYQGADFKTATTETLYMRPIFSGATDKSNIDHSIAFWLNKFGTEKEVTSALNDRADLDAGAVVRFRVFGKTNKCVDTGGGTSYGQTKFHIWDCVDTNKNQWFIYDKGSQQLRWAGNPNLCVDDGGGSYAGHTKLHLWTCMSKHPNQRWVYDENLLRWRNPVKNLCLDDGGAYSNGEYKMHLWDCNVNNVNQRFELLPQYDAPILGAVSIV